MFWKKEKGDIYSFLGEFMTKLKERIHVNFPRMKEKSVQLFK